MPLRMPRISRAWQSAAVAIAIGLSVSMLVINAELIEISIRRCRITDSVIAQNYTKFDSITYDWLFNRRGPHNLAIENNESAVPSIPQVVIVGIRDSDIARNSYIFEHLHSGYPFRRSIHAHLIRLLKHAGATVVGLDINFSDASPYGPKDDAEFADALKECGNVVLEAQSVARKGLNIQVHASGGDFPLPELRQAARATGFAELPTDVVDGAIRRFQLYTVHADPDLPTGNQDFLRFGPLIAALYQQYRRAPSKTSGSLPEAQLQTALADEIKHGEFIGLPLHYHVADLQSLDEVVAVKPADIKNKSERWQRLTPLEQDAAIRFQYRSEDQTIPICFAGRPGRSSCASYSYQDVILPQNAALLKSWFAGKVVLVGSMINEEHADAQTTPLSSESKRFGIDIHANVVHTVLAGHYYRDFEERNRIALVWMCGLLTALLVVRLKPLMALVPVLAMTVAIGWIMSFSFAHYIFLRPVQIFAATFLSYTLESVYFFSVEDRRARRARSTFQRYVGPKVMERVLDTNFKPGTVEERNLTIMFTDVQGFTSLSEKMSPSEVVNTFNRYLNEMVEIIDSHGGTLDKIMGDGVMAYFNAPLPLERHEQKAVECALEMQKAMRAWRELSESLSLPPLKVRIGINAGDVVFGEVGAKRQLGYTVIGDAVNAAARLEPLNKQFGTEILISEIVLHQLDGSFETHYVGELEIRGREEGIRAYSVTGRKTAGSQG